MVGGVVAVMIIFLLVAPQAFSGLFSRLFSPFWRITASFYTAENAALQQQIQAHSADAVARDLLEQENSELKIMLGRAPTKNSVLAVVLKKPPFSAYDNLIIDIGADHGAATDDFVYAISPASLSVDSATPNTTMATAGQVSTTSAASTTAFTSTTVRVSNLKVPIGLITEVDSSTSKVELFSSPGKKYNVEIGKKHVTVTATGRGGGTFEAVLPREANVEVGDVVIIPSIEPLAFATVTSIISDPARPFATILFQSPVNTFELHWVEVDMKPDVKK